MNNNLTQWLALTCAVIGGTVFISAIDKHTALNTQAHKSHLESHERQEKHEADFRASVLAALDAIKTHTAP